MGAIAAAMFGGSGSDRPVESPASWVLAAAARRQFGQTEKSSRSADTADALPTAQSMAATAVLVTANAGPSATVTKQGEPNKTTGKVTGKVTASDPDGDHVTFTSPITTPKGSVKVSSSGAFTYTPTAAARHAAAAVNASAAAKTDTFSITASDGLGGVATVPVTVAITPVNAAPTAKPVVNKPDAVSGNVTGKVNVTDKDADTAAFTTTTPANGAVVMNQDGTFTYTPTAAARDIARAASKTGTDKFTVTVNDGHGATKTVAVTVRIAPTDTAPVNAVFTASAPNASTGGVKGTVVASDNEDDKLTYGGSTTTAKGKVTVSTTGTFTYTPSAAARHTASAVGASAQSKTDTFIVNVTDQYGATTAVPITVNILGANDVPRNAKAVVGQPNKVTGVVTGTVTASDGDKDALNYTGSVTNAQGNVLVNTDGTFTYTPTQAARAKAAATAATTADKRASFDVTANDGHGGTTTISVTVPISPNAAPRNTDFDWDFSDSATVIGKVTATDPDGDTLTYSGPATTPKGTLTVTSDGAFTYTPTAAASHATTADGANPNDDLDTFTVIVSDGRGAVTPVEVTVIVLGYNNGPNALNQSYSMNENTVLSGNVLVGDSDPDGDTLTVGFVSGHDHGSLVLNSDGSFTYTPVANFNGTDSFTFTVSDGHGTSQTATANIRVNDVAAPPPPSGPTLSQQVGTFVSNTSGKTIANPDGSYSGECVSLVRQYLEQVFNIRTGPWGNAVDYRSGGTGGNQLAARGFTWHTDRNFQDGDILVFGQNSQAQTSSLGHIGIWSGGRLYDQNDGWRANARTANYSPYGSLSPACLGYWRPAGAGSGGGGGSTPTATSGTKSGTARVIQLVNVRNDPSVNGPVVAQYSPGQTFNYDSWVVANGYQWVSYKSYSGVRRYVAEARTDGSVVYLTGGVFH